jgi:LPS-assembly lipoprotein
MMKRLAIPALCLSLMGCGFHPMYASGQLSPQMASIYVEPIAESTGYELRNHLIDLLHSDGDPGGKTYRLKIILTNTNQPVTLQNDATITRYNDTLKASYVLSDDNDKPIAQGDISSLSSYNVVTSPYATLSAQHDSDQRAADDLAERIQLDLGVFFHRMGPRQP